MIQQCDRSLHVLSDFLVDTVLIRPELLQVFSGLEEGDCIGHISQFLLEFRIHDYLCDDAVEIVDNILARVLREEEGVGHREDQVLDILARSCRHIGDERIAFNVMQSEALDVSRLEILHNRDKRNRNGIDMIAKERCDPLGIAAFIWNNPKGAGSIHFQGAVLEIGDSASTCTVDVLLRVFLASSRASLRFFQGEELRVTVTLDVFITTHAGVKSFQLMSATPR
jgi:hypothetical protein